MIKLKKIRKKRKYCCSAQLYTKGIRREYICLQQKSYYGGREIILSFAFYLTLVKKTTSAQTHFRAEIPLKKRIEVDQVAQGNGGREFPLKLSISVIELFLSGHSPNSLVAMSLHLSCHTVCEQVQKELVQEPVQKRKRKL